VLRALTSYSANNRSLNMPAEQLAILKGSYVQPKIYGDMYERSAP